MKSFLPSLSLLGLNLLLGSFHALAQAPANDECATATPLPVNAACTNTLGTNAGATTSAGYGGASCAPGSYGDVWYSLVIPASNSIIVTTSQAVGSPLRNTGLTLYSSCDPTTEIGCNNDISTTNFFSRASVIAPVGSIVYVRVFNVEVGSTSLDGAFNICATPGPAVAPNDAEVQVIYTLASVASATSPVPVRARVRNAGLNPLTNVPVVLTVSGATSFTNTQTVPSLPPGAVTVVTFAAFPVTAASGTNTVRVAVAPDDAPANDVQTVTQTVTAGTLSYVQGPLTGGSGILLAGGIQAVRYRVNMPTPVLTVTPTFDRGGTAGDTYQVLIYSGTGATNPPDAVLYTSPVRPRLVAGGPDPVAIPNTVVMGDFFVAVRNTTANNIGLGYQQELPLLRSGTFYGIGPGFAWQDLSSTFNGTFQPRLALDVTLRAATVMTTRTAWSAEALGVFPNPAQRAFTLSVPALAGERTAELSLFNTLGQVVRTRVLDLAPHGTQTTVDVAGLPAGLYTVRVRAGASAAARSVLVE